MILGMWMSLDWTVWFPWRTPLPMTSWMSFMEWSTRENSSRRCQCMPRTLSLALVEWTVALLVLLGITQNTPPVKLFNYFIFHIRPEGKFSLNGLISFRLLGHQCISQGSSFRAVLWLFQHPYYYICGCARIFAGNCSRIWRHYSAWSQIALRLCWSHRSQNHRDYQKGKEKELVFYYGGVTQSFW